MYSLFPAEQRAPQPPLDRDQVPDEVRADFSQLLDWFTPNTYVCWSIIAINIVIFVLMLMSGFNPDKATPQALMKWGVDYGPATITQGQWWRMVTSCFIHMGVVHIGFNMVVLYQIGPFMERLLGSIGFFIVYMVAGLAGAVCSLWWNPYVYSAGASGAIFGLYGALIGFLCLRRDSIPGPVLANLLKSAVLFLVYNAVFGFIHAGTDIAAHVGGLIGGLICGLVVSTPINAGFRQRRLVRAAAAGLGCTVLLLGLASQLRHPTDLLAEITKFSVVETKVINTYNTMVQQAKGMKDDDLAEKIQAQVMKPWSAERQSLGKVNGLPSRQQHVVSVLLDYMDARQRAWAILLQGLKTHNPGLVKQSFQLQLQAQTSLKDAMPGQK